MEQAKNNGLVSVEQKKSTVVTVVKIPAPARSHEDITPVPETVLSGHYLNNFLRCIFETHSRNKEAVIVIEMDEGKHMKIMHAGTGLVDAPKIKMTMSHMRSLGENVQDFRGLTYDDLTADHVDEHHGDATITLSSVDQHGQMSVISIDPRLIHKISVYHGDSLMLFSDGKSFVTGGDSLWSIQYLRTGTMDEDWHVTYNVHTIKFPTDLYPKIHRGVITLESAEAFRDWVSDKGSALRIFHDRYQYAALSGYEKNFGSLMLARDDIKKLDAGTSLAAIGDTFRPIPLNEAFEQINAAIETNKEYQV